MEDRRLQAAAPPMCAARRLPLLSRQRRSDQPPSEPTAPAARSVKGYDPVMSRARGIDDGSREEFARRAGAAYDTHVKPNVRAADEGKFVALDVDTGAYEIDGDELSAMNRLEQHHPQAAVWLTRVGSRYAYRLGRRRLAHAD